MASLPTILLIFAALSMGATIIAALAAFRSQREAVNAIFPIVREEESSRAQRARISIFVWIAVTALFLGGWLATLRLGNSDDELPVDSGGSASSPAGDQAGAAVVRLVTDTPRPEITPSPTASQAAAEAGQPAAAPLNTGTAVSADTPASALPTSTETPTGTPTTEPSATFTTTPLPPTVTLTHTPVPPTDTPAPSPTPASPTAIPTQPAVHPFPTMPPHTPAPPEVRAGPIQFATQMTEDLTPIDPSDTFPEDVESIYAIYPVKGMRRGLPIKVVWYWNGAEIANEQGQWEWPSDTRSFTFFTPKGEGIYKLELYVNDSIVAANLFEVGSN